MLVLEIEWLLGVCFAARTPATPEPDWPPQPDRVFSALVATWGARGAREEERAALEWLERQGPPALKAVKHVSRDTVTAYVPPNDSGAGDIRILPDRRRRQPRQFPAARLLADPHAPHLRLTWPQDAPPGHLAALRALARDTSYVGHSSALVRCDFPNEPLEWKDLTPRPTTAAPYPERLRELESTYARHVATADPTARPRPAPLPEPILAPEREPEESCFGRRWIVLEFAEGERPDLRAAAVIGHTMRDALMSAWPDPIPEWLSGHLPDGTPSRDTHLAVVPLANLGFGYSAVARQPWHGLALVLPRAIEDEWTGDATPQSYLNRQALEDAVGRALTLRLGRLGEVCLRRVAAPDIASLRPGRYLDAGRFWSTVTPIALDRHPKGEDARQQAIEIVRESCARIGLPPPDAVHLHKHAAIAGAPSAWPPGGAPVWTGWARPGSLSGRPLTHATLRFKNGVRGPVILGAGRFFGLGLCLPVTGPAPC